MRHPDPCARVTFTSRQIKTQMQAHRGLSTPKVSTVLSNVYSGAGLRGFWSGCQPNVARCFIGNACEIGCYDEAKTRLIAAGVPDGPLGHFGASGIAGTVSAIFSTPVDVVKTRLMAQAGGVPTEGVVQYAGVVDCFMRMPAIEGVASLYKGFVPSTCMHNAEARAWTCLWLTRTPACTMLAQSRPLSHAGWRLREPSRSQSPHAKLPGRSCTSSRTSRRSRGFGVRTHEGVRIPLESDLVFLPKTQSVHTFPKSEGAGRRRYFSARQGLLPRPMQSFNVAFSPAIAPARTSPGRYVSPGRQASPGRHVSPGRTVFASHLPVRSRRKEVEEESDLPRLAHRMGGRRLRRWARDNFWESVVAMPHPDSDEDQGAERPYFQPGARFGIINQNGFAEAEAAIEAARHSTPPRSRPTAVAITSSTSAAVTRLTRLSRVDRAVLIEFAETIELQEAERRLRQHLRTAARVILQSAGALPPATSSAALPPALPTVASHAPSMAPGDVGSAMLGPVASPAAAHAPSMALDLALAPSMAPGDDESDSSTEAADEDGWQMVDTAAVAGSRWQVVMGGAASEGTAAGLTDVHPQRGRSKPRRRRAAATAVRHRTKGAAPPPMMSAVQRAVAGVPVCELPPTANPTLRMMHQAASRFYGLQVGSVRSPAEATYVDECAVSARVVPPSSSSSSSSAAAANGECAPNGEAGALITAAEALVAAARLSIDKALAATAKAEAPRRRLQMCEVK